MPRGRGSYLWCLGSAVTVIKAGASSMASKYSVSSSSSLASPFEDCTLPVGTKGSRCSVAACPLWNPSSTSVTAVPSVLLLLCPLQHRLPSQPISHQPPFPSTRRGCRAGFQLLKPRMCPPAFILPPVEARKAPLPHSEPPPKRHQAAQPAPAPASPRLPGNPVWVKTEKEKKKPNVSGVAQTDFLALGFSSHALINISLPCCLGRGHQEARSHSLSHTYPTHSPNIKRC